MATWLTPCVGERSVRNAAPSKKNHICDGCWSRTVCLIIDGRSPCATGNSPFRWTGSTKSRCICSWPMRSAKTSAAEGCKTGRTVAGNARTGRCARPESQHDRRRLRGTLRRRTDRIASARRHLRRAAAGERRRFSASHRATRRRIRCEPASAVPSSPLDQAGHAHARLRLAGSATAARARAVARLPPRDQPARANAADAKRHRRPSATARRTRAHAVAHARTGDHARRTSWSRAASNKASISSRAR